MGSAVGLNYQSVEFFFRINRVKNQKQIFCDLQEIELGALESIRKQEEKRKE